MKPLLQLEISGIVLAGGKSSRMGVDKGLMQFKNRSMVAYSIGALAAVSKDIVLVANSTDYERFPARLVMDEIQAIGPLGGLMTGLRHAKHAFSFVLPCDSPKIPSKLLLWMLEKNQRQTTVLKAEGRIYPLIGIYRKADLPIIEHMVANQDLRMQNLVQMLNAQILEPAQDMPGFSMEWLRNYNSQDDFGRENS